MSDSPLLGRTAAVMRDRRDVGNAGDLQPAVVQCTHRRLAAGAWASDAHLDVLHAVLLRSHAGLLRGHLGGKRGALAGAAEATAPRSRPGKRVSLAIGDRDDGVVEGRMDVRDRIEHVLAGLLRLLGARGGGARSGSRGAGGALYFLVSHGGCANLLRLTRRGVQLDCLLARTLARAGVRARALAPDRQAAPVAHAAIRAQVHETL